MKKFIGHRENVSQLKISNVYLSLSKEDEEAAILLKENRLYNAAIYMYIQAMEKKIKSHICKKINVTIPYYANMLRDIGHSLDKSINLLIEVLAGNNIILKKQLSEQLKSQVFENIEFSKLYNNCRYPYYDYNKKEYSHIVMRYDDCVKIIDISRRLDKFLQDFDRL